MDSLQLLSRDHWITDPRADDYPADSRAWQLVLTAAYDTCQQPHELFGALHGARCFGARLAANEKQGWKIEPGVEDAEMYVAARTTFLLHAELLKRLLTSPRATRV